MSNANRTLYPIVKMLKLTVTICCLFNVARDNNYSSGVIAFVTPLNNRCGRTSISARFEKKWGSQNGVKLGSARFAEKGHEPNLNEAPAATIATKKRDLSNSDIFNRHFRGLVSKEDLSNLFSVCNEVQNSHIYQPAKWADSCKVVEQPQDGTHMVIATRDVKKGQVLTLFPIHALGLRNVRDSKDGVEFIEFNNVQDEDIFKKEILSATKLNIPMTSDSNDGRTKDLAHVVTGKKPYIKLFVMSLPGKETKPGWLGSIIKTTSTAEEANCITLPLPYATPFCAVVATEDIKEGYEVVRGKQPVDWNAEVELNNILEEEQKKNISMLRNQVQKAFVGSFHKINLQYPGLKRVHSDPDIYEIEDFLTADECDRLIAKAKPNLERDKIYSDESEDFQPNEFKTYTEANIPQREMPSVIHKITSMACCGSEEIGTSSILNYKAGQKVAPHVDNQLLSEDELLYLCDSKSDTKYTRWGIVFCYLNDVPEGGTTYFPEIDLDIKPRKGLGLIHFCSDMDGRGDERTRHQGSPAIDEKWIFASSLWNTTDNSFAYLENRLDSLNSDII